MPIAYVVHIFAGSLGLIAGFIALSAAKGATLHRKSGMAFVVAMLTTSCFGMLISTVRGVAPAINIPAGLLTAYLVITSLRTLRTPAPGSRWLDVGLLLVALVVCVVDSTFLLQALANGGQRKGMPAFPFVMFGLVGLLATIGDVRVLRSGALVGARRLARHLWRMCFALFIAALSFFIGQAKVIPEPIRILPLLALPVLTVFVAMFYWLWRVQVRRSLRGIVVVSVPETV